MIQKITDFLMDFGAWGLFIHSFADAIIMPIPAFFLQVSLSLANPSTALWLATVGYIACLLGTPIGYLIGRKLGNTVLYKILKRSWVDSATAMFKKSGETAILIGSFTPIPFKVFTIMSGCLNFPLWRLLAYAAVGRAVKFYVVGILFYYYGRAAETMMKDVSLYIFVFAVPFLILFVIMKKRRQKRKLLQDQSSLIEADKADPSDQTSEVSAEGLIVTHDAAAAPDLKPVEKPGAHKRIAALEAAAEEKPSRGKSLRQKKLDAIAQNEMTQAPDQTS